MFAFKRKTAQAKRNKRSRHEGPTHHCALGVGHVVSKIRKVARLMGLELKVIG